MLTDNNKMVRMLSSLNILTRHCEEGNEFLNRIVTRDETWVYHDTLESKRQLTGHRQQSLSSKNRLQ
ncbi:hypothetical protein PGB90_006764 [Kerria lacca]